jgi:hypothetical protein
VDNDDLLWRINELYDQYSGESAFWERIAEVITQETGETFTKDKVRGRWRRQGGQQAQQEGKKEKDTEPDLTVDADGVSSVDELIAKSGIDLGTYMVDHFILNVWDGKEQVKVWLKRKTPDPFNESDFLDKIGDVVSRHIRLQPVVVKPPKKEQEATEYLFVPVIFDAHLDSPKASCDYVDVLRRLVSMGTSAGYTPSRTMFVIGNDFGHIDNAAYSTTGGTLVGSRSTYLDSVDERCSKLLLATDFLRSVSDNLDILSIPGNHDRFSTYWLAKVIDAYYRADTRVFVDSGQSPRKYYRYGRTLFGLTHGSEERSYDMASLMAVESPLDWAATETRIWLTGHLHQQKRMYNMLSEKFGVIQRIFPALVKSDDWHVLKGYIGNDVAAQLLVYDDKGQVAEFHLSVR